MSSTLHILNGDSTSSILDKSGIEGDVVVWREMLCEGPLHKEVGSDEFWMDRYAYFENELGVDRIEYFDKSISEIIKLEDVSNYTDVVLWFEFDLFCQVNLLALCTYLLDNYVKKANYHLVCTGKVEGKDQLHSLSDFLPSEFQSLFHNKISLSKSNLEFAKECWTDYVENDIDKLKSYDFNQNSKFQYLQLAINQHLVIFPSENGLNQIENKIVEIINSSSLTENQIVRELLIWQQLETVYGFGDLQYFQYLKKLINYITVKDSRYYLNEAGKTVVLQ